MESRVGFDQASRSPGLLGKEEKIPRRSGVELSRGGPDKPPIHEPVENLPRDVKSKQAWIELLDLTPVCGGKGMGAFHGIRRR
jgi:hypothetical protein